MLYKKFNSTYIANEVLTNENIFVMNMDRAFHQDIRALRIAILEKINQEKSQQIVLLAYEKK